MYYFILLCQKYIYIRVPIFKNVFNLTKTTITLTNKTTQMKTEKNFDETETIRKNVNDAMKWFQNTNAIVIEAYTKQMEFAADLCNKSLNTAAELWNPAFDKSFKPDFKSTLEMQEKLISIVRSNIENIIAASKTTMNQIIELGKQHDTAEYSKETMKKIIESYSKQAEAITSFNQKYFDSIKKQFNAAKDAGAPFLENIKKEFETNLALSKKELETIIASYKKLANPTLEANKKMMNEMNAQMSNAINNNIKLWSELINHLPHYAKGAKAHGTTHHDASSNGHASGEHHKHNGVKTHTTTIK